MSLIEIDHVTVTFGHRRASWLPGFGGAVEGVTAVADATFDIEAGEALGIVGESGSGKTTLMRAVMGFAPIHSGEIRFRGTPLTPKRTVETRRAVQMVFQDPGTTLNPARRVGESIEELLKVHGLAGSSTERRTRVAELFDRVRLPSSVQKAYPRELSGGMKQRVAIARSLALEPSILIADEATSALDVIVQASVLDLFDELRRDAGITLVFITHDLALVRYLCDRAVVMNAGAVVEVSNVAELFDDPQDPYTRELLAAVPQLPGDVKGRS